MKLHSHSASIKSSGALLTAANVFKADKRTPWNLQKQVPAEIILQRAEKAAKEEIAANREEIARKGQERLRAKGYVPASAAPLGVFATKTEEGYKVLGFGMTVKTIADVFGIADANNRTFVKIDGEEIARD